MAEAFTQAKLSANPSPYAKEVLEIVDKYFKKPLEKSEIGGNINIEIDELTPCLRRISDNAIVSTTVNEIKPTSKDFTDWEFDWTVPGKNGYTICELKATGDSRTQGLIALKNDARNIAYHVDVIEAAPFNNPHHASYTQKEYSGVGGHLFAEAIKRSYEAGYDGAIYFTAKTSLVQHYQDAFGAVLVNPNLRIMIIEGEAAKKLYDRYYGSE